MIPEKQLYKIKPYWFRTAKVKLSNLLKGKFLKSKSNNILKNESIAPDENKWIEDHDYEITKLFFNNLLLDDETAKTKINL